jgi:Phage derived protein Gp49-like (DUF891)
MASNGPRKIPVVFYRTRGGSEIVRNWLRDLDEGDRNALGLDLMRVQYRWPVGMPLCRSLGDGLWEVRTALPSHRIARVLSVFIKTGSWCYTGLSRRPRIRPMRNWRWRANVNVNLKIEGGCHGKKNKETTHHRQAEHP